MSYKTQVRDIVLKQLNNGEYDDVLKKYHYSFDGDNETLIEELHNHMVNNNDIIGNNDLNTKLAKGMVLNNIEEVAEAFEEFYGADLLGEWIISKNWKALDECTRQYQLWVILKNVLQEYEKSLLIVI